MPSPVECLQYNIIDAFENPNGSAVDELRATVSRGLISPDLDLHLDLGPPRGPHVTKVEGQPASIVLHISHLELLWAFIYGWIILYEEAVQRPMLDNQFDGRILLRNDLISRAAELLEWASGIRNNYTPWPEGLPSPQHSESDAERDYALKANGIFQHAAAFLLYHEYGHVRQGHLDAVDPAQERAHRLATAVEMEREADDFAYRVLVGNHDSEDIRKLKAWAVLAPALSSLYLVDGRAGLQQRRHPHLHHRIADLLAKLDFQDEAIRFYYQYLCAIVLRTFDKAYAAGNGATLTARVFETADDAFNAEMDELDEFLGSQG